MSMSHYIATGYWAWRHEAPRHFPSLTVSYNIDGITAQGVAVTALETWHTATGMNFVRTSSQDADIMFSYDGWAANSDSVTSHGLIVQSTVNVPVTYQYQQFAYVHEIGHALGLGHPGPYNAAINRIFAEDDWGHSAMSYYGGGFAPPDRPMSADIAAWHLIYDGRIDVPTFERPKNLLIGGSGGVDVDWYNGQNLDVWAAGVHPQAHYNAFGWHESRDPNAYFDTSLYLQTYADVAAAGINPLDHYQSFGWREGRDPSPLFDTASYLAANPDVAAAGVNPLEHYMVHGINEGRPSWLV